MTEFTSVAKLIGELPKGPRETPQKDIENTLVAVQSHLDHSWDFAGHDRRAATTTGRMARP
jgi:hypothetical protein